MVRYLPYAISLLILSNLAICKPIKVNVKVQLKAGEVDAINKSRGACLGLIKEIATILNNDFRADKPSEELAETSTVEEQKKHYKNRLNNFTKTAFRGLAPGYPTAPKITKTKSCQ